jgi:polyketide biosynthesis 3-hydroxy-3-methylglutaryl-CoA synthase-like enzyme PksG
LSYLDCCEKAFLEYQKRVDGSDLVTSFGYLAMHTPFGGMVKGAHRNIMRKVAKARPNEIETDFELRMQPSLNYCQRVGNIMGASTLMAIASTIDHGNFDNPKRIGCFSYGSGCCSEFFSGVSSVDGQALIRAQKIKEHLDRRHELTMEEYDELLVNSNTVKFGMRNVVLDNDFIPAARTTHGAPTLFLKEINEFHRKYEYVS